jgi:hypothetical protein
MVGHNRRPRPPKPTHAVERKVETGEFIVTSGRSGETYIVSLEPACTCEGFRNRRKCSHVDAAAEFAQKLVETGQL